MRLGIIFIVLVCCSAPATQQQELYFQPSDFTAEGLFTSGIEGPCIGADGNLYVVNFGTKGTIGRVSPNGDASLFVELPEGSVGNGIRMNNDGNLYIADYTNHNVLLIDMKTNLISAHAHELSMNQPNDLSITTDGTLYCSDPNWKDGTGQLWRVNPDGSTHLLAADMGTTNGIEVSPSEKLLYVNESVQRKIWVFDIDKDKSLSNKRLLREFPDHGFDGMRCDTEGNLFVTRYGKGTVVMLSPQGDILEEIQLKGLKPSNIAFGGKDGKTCYVTLQDRGAIETFRVPYPGRSHLLAKKN